MITVIDHFLNDETMWDKIYRYLLQVSPHYFRETSLQTDTYDLNTCFYSSEYTLDDTVINFLYNRIVEASNLSGYYPSRINSNIQFLGMGIDSDYHSDDCDITALWMCSPNVEGGEFEYLNDDKESSNIDYVKDRLIIFDSNIPHRAKPPTNLTARLSLAFKMKKNGKNI